ncbi:DUF6114 domain-containing protein [Microbacterium kyungheense]|uniref:Integral membrane protein n=1 Tax=Microbacterium kyungheense TaxID=1263636 RepID=A0A543F1L5_9MICO|nr:DUF6114 domain-containing protein [Microbacterium kyungheense]TQM27699.1 hypothetical protein FB391_1726 [Microbacterium kyungheense]
MHPTDPHTPDSPDRDEAAPGRAATWFRSRPVIGGGIAVLGALAMLLSTQLDLGNIRVHVGIEGMQATILPIVIALAGILAVVMPAHRIFYGVIVLVGSVYSLVAVNLGGFFVGFVLGCVGGVMVVSWAPRRAAAAEDVDAAPAAEGHA